MSWRLIVHLPDGASQVHEFEWPREAWSEFQRLVHALEADGFVAGELEAIRYGVAWVQHLTRDAATCRLEMFADVPAN